MKCRKPPLKFRKAIPKWIKIVFIFILTFSMFPLEAQKSKTQLEEDRNRLKRQVRNLEGMFKETSQKKLATYDRFVTMKKQAETREELINVIEEELSMADERITRTEEMIAALEVDIEELKVNYASMMRYALRQKLTSNPLLFMLSASDFNEAFQRWQFLRQYDQHRHKQAGLIQRTAESLKRKQTQLIERKQEKENLLQSEIEQKDLHAREMIEVKKLIGQLKSQENRLRTNIDIKNRDKEKLNNLITDVIRSNMKNDRAQGRKQTPRPSSPSVTTPRSAPKAEIEIGTSFQQNRGKLPWPVDNGFISGRFGKQSHPTIKRLEIINNGIDIRTRKGSEVRAVFEGKVKSVSFIPEYQNVVIIQHGKYYTTYSHLRNVSVNTGDHVKAMQSIGSVYTDENKNTSEIHFELWYSKRRLNPKDWIKKYNN